MTDPTDKDSGLNTPRFKSDIVLHTSTPAISATEDFGQIQDGETHIIHGPGEYEIKEVQIKGWPLKKDSQTDRLRGIFRVRFDDLSLGFLDSLSNFKEPEILEELGDIDILFIPGGGDPYLSTEEAAKLVRQVDPRIVIPTHFKVKGLKRKASEVKDFLKELGLEDTKPQEKVSLKRKDLTEKLQAIVLTI